MYGSSVASSGLKVLSNFIKNGLWPLSTESSTDLSETISSSTLRSDSLVDGWIDSLENMSGSEKSSNGYGFLVKFLYCICCSLSGNSQNGLIIFLFRFSIKFINL